MQWKIAANSVHFTEIVVIIGPVQFIEAYLLYWSLSLLNFDSEVASEMEDASVLADVVS